MFYRPEDGHGLAFNPFGAIISPRPIAWISTTGSRGDNLAPYSFFNAVAYEPPQLMFASNGTKDTLSNIQETKVFAVNIVAKTMAEQMNLSSTRLAADIDEFTHANIEKAACQTIECPRISNAPATLECRLGQVISLKGDSNFLITGEVCGVHLNDAYIKEGRFDVTLFSPVARLGYNDFLNVDIIYEMVKMG